MEFEEVEALVQEHIKMIAFGKGAFNEALERATAFLTMVAILSDFKLERERKKAKLTTLREAFYSHAMNQSSSKQVTEKKAEAESNKEYTDQREAVEEIEAEISWARVNMEIFNNAHVTYRQMAKGD